MTEDQENPSEFEILQPGEVPSARKVVDRRRPGRPEHVNPWLIPLLRFKPSVEQTAAPHEEPDEPEPDEDDHDERRGELGIARDIALGLLLSVPFWVALAVFWFVG